MDVETRSDDDTDDDTNTVDAAESDGSTPTAARPANPVWRRVFFGSARTVIALAAAAALAVTGYNWAQLHRLNDGIARTKVFPDTQTAQPGGPAVAAPPPLTSDVNILLVGVDSRSDPHGNPLPPAELAMLHAGPDDGEHNTDTMMLIHIPAGGQQATAISFPRDSYVQIAGGYGKHKLNSAFAYAYNDAVHRLTNQGMTDQAQIEQEAATEGRRNLIATIEQLIGNAVTINRYAEINLVGFYDLSLAVGGVPVCVNQATHDDFTGASFPAGEQILSGVQALNFVRQRHGLPNGDLDRIVRQQAFIGALANKMLSAGTLASPSKMSALIGAIQGSVTLSEGWDVTSFAMQMQGLTSGAIHFTTMPTGDDLRVADGAVLAVDPEQVRQFAADVLGPNAGATTGPTSTSVIPGDSPAPGNPAPTTPAGSGPATPTATASPATTTATSPATTTPLTVNGIRCVN